MQQYLQPSRSANPHSFETPKTYSYYVFKVSPMLKLFEQLFLESLDLLFDWFAVCFGFFGADVPAGGEDEVVLLDFVDAGCSGEAGYVLVLAVVVAPGVVGAGDLGDVGVVEDAQAAGFHAAELAGVDEQDFALTLAVAVAVAVLGDEPQADGDAGVEEQPVGHGDDAVDEVGFDELAADVAFDAAIGGQGAVGQDEPGGALRAEVVDEVLDPGEVGVALRRGAVLPAGVVGELGVPPVGDVERRVGE